MKSCVGCKYAKWGINAMGRLHPSGDGKCTFNVVVPELPGAMYWVSSSGAPKPCGGYINRKTGLNRECTYFDKEGI